MLRQKSKLFEKTKHTMTEKAQEHKKNLSFDRESKKTNLCTWSLEIKIEAFLDKNRSFRRNNEHAVKKQKTEIKNAYKCK